MSFFDHSCTQIRISLNILTVYKEGALYVIAAKHIEELRGHIGIGTAVEGEINMVSLTGILYDCEKVVTAFLRSGDAAV